MATGWQEDARFVGAFVRGGNWEVGLRIARNVEIGNGQGERTDRTSRNTERSRVSLKEFGREAGVSENTVRRYLAAWEWAAGEGIIDHAADLSPDDEYDFEASGLTQDSWKEFYEIACMNPPPWNPQGKPMDSAYGGGRQAKPPTADKIVDAIKNDPATRLAAREAIEEADAERRRSQSESTTPIQHDEPLTDLVGLSVTVRQAKRALQDLLGKVVGFKDYPDGRHIINDYVDDLQRYLDAVRQVSQGDSMDHELARLLEESSS